jgi:hypothetical protein
MKSHEVRERIHKLAGHFRNSLNDSHWWGTWVRFRTPILGVLSWVGWGLVVAVVLADLFCGRYRAVGPWVLGLASAVGGMVLARYLVRRHDWGERRAGSLDIPAPSGRDVPTGWAGNSARGVGNPWLFAVLSGVFSLLGLLMLAHAAQLQVPENASLAWTFPPGQRPVDRPFIWWEKIRVAQCDAPVFLFFGGLMGALSLAGSISRGDRPDGERPPAPPATSPAGPHPGLIVFILWLLLILVNVRIFSFS